LGGYLGFNIINLIRVKYIQENFKKIFKFEIYMKFQENLKFGDYNFPKLLYFNTLKKKFTICQKYAPKKTLAKDFGL